MNIRTKTRVGGWKFLLHPMETDSVTTWHQDSIVIFGDEDVVGMPQRHGPVERRPATAQMMPSNRCSYLRVEAASLGRVAPQR